LQKTFLGENQWFSPIPLSSLGNLGFPKPFLIGENIIIKMEGALAKCTPYTGQGTRVPPDPSYLQSFFYQKKIDLYFTIYPLYKLSYKQQ
jgi:hypothetical protein